MCCERQRMAQLEAASSSQVQVQFNEKALQEHGVTKQDLQVVWDKVSGAVSVLWSSWHSELCEGSQGGSDVGEVDCSRPGAFELVRLVASRAQVVMLHETPTRIEGMRTLFCIHGSMHWIKSSGESRSVFGSR